MRQTEIGRGIIIISIFWEKKLREINEGHS